jgi:hypothetical protein
MLLARARHRYAIAESVEKVRRRFPVCMADVGGVVVDTAV